MKKLIPMGLLLAACFLFTACPRDMGTVTGSVSFSGVPCQTGQPDFKVPPCTGPYPKYEIFVFHLPDTEEAILHTMTNDQGKFRIELPAGTYSIFTQNGPRPEMKKENKFEVIKGESIEFNLRVSTGIL